jgi:hypothetical protein
LEIPRAEDDRRLGLSGRVTRRWNRSNLVDQHRRLVTARLITMRINTYLHILTAGGLLKQALPIYGSPPPSISRHSLRELITRPTHVEIESVV